jgi:hypothetical protein
LLGVDHGQVVVGLGQFREFLGQLGEHGDGVVGLVHLGQDDALEEPALGILGLSGEVLVDLLQRLGMLPLLDQFADVLQGVGARRCGGQQQGMMQWLPTGV